MQPFQEAEEEIVRRGEMPAKYAKKGLEFGLGSAASYGGTLLASRVMPFLSKFIPESLAIKGIEKVEPRLGKFVDKALKNGGTFEETKEFIKNKIEEDPGVQDIKNDNPIWKFNKKLAKLIDDSISIGHTIDEVEGMARSPGNKFKKDIEHIEKSIGMPFRELLRMVYGGSKPKEKSKMPMAMPEDNLSYTTPPQQAKKVLPQETAQETNQAIGSGQAKLMQMLQKINEARGPR